MGGVGYVAAFVGGILALLSPCGALLLPSFFAYAFDRPTQLVGRTGIFYLGLITSLVPLGVTASSLTIFVRTHQATVITVAAVVLIVLGVITAFGGGIEFGTERMRQRAAQGGTRPAAVYGLGLVYGLTGFCTGPILGSILVLAAAAGQPVRGGLLLMTYAFGMVVPLFVLALVWKRLGRGAQRALRGRTLKFAGHEFHSTALISGGVLVAVGGLMLVTGGALVENQTLALWGAAVEEWAVDVGEKIPDRLLAVVVVVAAAGWFVWRLVTDEPNRP